MCVSAVDGRIGSGVLAVLIPGTIHVSQYAWRQTQQADHGCEGHAVPEYEAEDPAFVAGLLSCHG